MTSCPRGRRIDGRHLDTVGIQRKVIVKLELEGTKLLRHVFSSNKQIKTHLVSELFGY
jgi:hypothetical protein